jgi:hypothetical protein
MKVRILTMPRLSAKLFVAAYAAIICLGLSTAVAVEPKWIDTRQIGPFVCRATFPLDDYERLLANLPELQRELTRTLGLPVARQPIHVYLFGKADEHQQYLASHFPQVPYRQALFTQSDGELAVYAFRKAELDVDLRHECTHALLHASLPEIPLWLDEGLAEYFEAPPGERAFGHPNYDALRWNLRLGMVRSIETLESRRELADMAALDYRYSWAWVHFMLHGSETGHHALVNYLADLRRGADAGNFSTRLDAALPDSAERFVQHFKHWRR